MKIQRKILHWVIPFVTAASLLAGCLSGIDETSTGGPNMVNLSSATHQFTSTATITQTPENSPTPTITFTPEVSPTITLTATPENTPTPTSTVTPLPTPTPLPAPFLDTFIANLENGNAWQVVGVYVDGLMALRVVQQPSSNAAYVSTLPNTATYFAMVNSMTGNTGLLAHNYLAGTYFFDLQPGQVAVVIYGDGSTEEYMVADYQEFQALSPNSPTSNFVDLATGETLTSTDLFYKVFGGGSKTTFQTCIAQGNELSWGRLFVIAPIE